MAIEETQTLNLFSWIFAWSCVTHTNGPTCFEAVFTHGADWILIRLCWIIITLFDLICLFICYLYSNVQCTVLPPLPYLSARKLNHWFLSAVPTSGGISKLSHGLLTLKFSQSITSTITAAAPFHVIIFLQQCLPLLPGRLFFFFRCFAVAINSPGLPK